MSSTPEASREAMEIAEQMVIDAIATEYEGGPDCLMMLNGTSASTLGNTQLAVKVIAQLMVAYNKRMTPRLAAAEKVVEAARILLMSFEHLSLTHEQLCNGVHDDGGTCEGEALHSRMIESAREALTAYDAAKVAGGGG